MNCTIPPAHFLTQEHMEHVFPYSPYIYKKINAYVIFYILKIVIMAFLVFHVFQLSVSKGRLEHIHSQEDPMAEKDIVTQILRYLKKVPRCFAWKEHGGMYGTAGIPDIIACINGRFYGFEVKTRDGKPTKLQEATIRKILASGGTALVVRSADEVRTVIDGPLH